MADTDFGTKSELSRAWALDTWHEARANSLWRPLMAEKNGIIMVDTGMKRTPGAEEAIFKLVTGLKGTGVSGDGTLRGNEESITAQYLKMKLAMLRNGVISKGRFSDQKSVIDFREEAHDQLVIWHQEMFDALLTQVLSGWAFSKDTNGGTRTVLAGQTALTSLEFASDVSAPTANRHFKALSTGGIAPGNTATMAAGANKLTNDALVMLKAEAQTQRLKAPKIDGRDAFQLILHPKQFAQLCTDEHFRENFLHAGVKGDKNPLLSGAEGITNAGLVIRVNDYICNTSKATSGSAKWGSGSDIDGARALLLGQQAACVSDFAEKGFWAEEDVDYKNKHGISVGMMIAMRKAVFTTSYNGTSEDLGTIALDTNW